MSKLSTTEIAQFPLEKKLMFYKTYIPQYIDMFASYLAQVQLCVDYNYFQSLDIVTKVSYIVKFYQNLLENNFETIDNIQFVNNIPIKQGVTKWTVEDAFFWVSKYNTLCKQIQNEINKKQYGKLKLNEISPSIGLLTYRKNKTDNSVSPYWDYSDKTLPLNVPVGGNVYEKLTKGNTNSLQYSDHMTNALFKYNMCILISDEGIKKDKQLVKEKSGLCTTNHQENLITDTISYFNLNDWLSLMNGELSKSLSYFYIIIKHLQLDNPYPADGELIENNVFTTIDNEGKILKKDIYQNIITD